MYPIELIEEFRVHFNEVWMPQRAPDYFKGKGPKALPYLPKLLAQSVSMVVGRDAAAQARRQPSQISKDKGK